MFTRPFPAGVLAIVFSIVDQCQRSIPLTPVHQTLRVGGDSWTVDTTSDLSEIVVRSNEGEAARNAATDAWRRIMDEIADVRARASVVVEGNSPDDKVRRKRKNEARQRLIELSSQLEAAENVFRDARTDEYRFPIKLLAGSPAFQVGDFAVPIEVLVNENAEPVTIPLYPLDSPMNEGAYAFGEKDGCYVYGQYAFNDGVNPMLRGVNLVGWFDPPSDDVSVFNFDYSRVEGLVREEETPVLHNALFGGKEDAPAETDKAIDLSGLTVKELVGIAKKEGIPLVGREKRQDLIEAIEKVRSVS